jgi:hypothetical protein
MLVANPKQRISASLALKHAYFEGFDPKADISSPALTTVTTKK